MLILHFREREAKIEMEHYVTFYIILHVKYICY